MLRLLACYVCLCGTLLISSPTMSYAVVAVDDDDDDDNYDDDYY